METLVLTTTALGSFGTLSLQARSRAFYVLFLHTLLALTVGSLTFRTLGGTGTLLIPFVDGWSESPLMHLDSLRAYALLTISLLSWGLVVFVKGRLIWSATESVKAQSSFVGSRYCCLMLLWIHMVAIISLVLA
ncbi:MAG: hypothetical protein EAZ91_20245 [Cytophagales bacterium]|nr:MAG: hypothetical protein EAZ91_20245 [Cytophagales bacterium]